jgi:hypothetical protein
LQTVAVRAPALRSASGNGRAHFLASLLGLPGAVTLNHGTFVGTEQAGIRPHARRGRGGDLLIAEAE